MSSDLNSRKIMLANKYRQLAPLEKRRKPVIEQELLTTRLKDKRCVQCGSTVDKVEKSNTNKCKVCIASNSSIESDWQKEVAKRAALADFNEYETLEMVNHGTKLLKRLSKEFNDYVFAELFYLRRELVKTRKRLIKRTEERDVARLAHKEKIGQVNRREGYIMSLENKLSRLEARAARIASLREIAESEPKPAKEEDDTKAEKPASSLSSDDFDFDDDTEVKRIIVSEGETEGVIMAPDGDGHANENSSLNGELEKPSFGFGQGCNY